MSEACTIKRFKSDTKNHKLVIAYDDGAMRHMTFANPKSSAYHFHITTWPGYLCFSGDMGTYVFSRLSDMFEFFRGKDINLGYWSEKLQAVDKPSGLMKFSEKLFKENVLQQFNDWDFSDAGQKRLARKELTEGYDCPFDRGYNTAAEALAELYRYKCEVTGNTFRDAWDYNYEEYSFRFVWCCRAILHGIGVYDKVTLKGK